MVGRMLRNKPSKLAYAEIRNLLISFVPEKDAFPGQTYFTQDWARHFKRRLELPRPGTIIIKASLDGQIPGLHEKDGRNLAFQNTGHSSGSTKYSTVPSITDFLVLHNLDYAEEPPPRLAEIIADKQATNTHCDTLLWAALLDAVEFFASHFGKCEDWHVLRGEGKNGRLKKLDEKDCDDEQEAIAKAIRDHPTCHIPSPVCPKHQPASQNTSIATRLRKRLFGWRNP